MLRPAAVSAAAAAVWLLAVLGPSLSLPAEDDSEAGFTLCSHCFYRQTPPRGASAEPPLRPHCHRLPGGQAFAALHKPACDTAAYSAFHLSHGWTEPQEQEGGELGTEEEDNIKVFIPALLGGANNPSPVSPEGSALQQWDSKVTTLLQSSITPRCNSLGGGLYILTGVGGLGATEDAGEECQTEPLWSAVCCSVPGGKGGFSLGLISQTDGGESQVTVKELEERLGVAELFSEGCEATDGEMVGVTAELSNEAQNVEELAADTTDEETDTENEESDTADKQTEAEGLDSHDSHEDIKDSRADRIAADPAATSYAKPDETEEERGDITHSQAERSVSYEGTETVMEEEKDTNSSSIIVSILYTALSIVKAPLRPVFSTITQLPGQVTYVLQEDLGVLSTLPGDTFSLIHLLTSDLFSWMGSAAEMLYGIGEMSICSAYYCTSSMLGALLDSCHIGVTGMGTLAGDTVGIFSGTLDNAWWVTKFFGGRLWEQSEGCVGTLVTEMGGQAKVVGGGMGRLVWRSVSGVVNAFRMGFGFVIGTIDLIFGALREAFGEESGWR